MTEWQRYVRKYLMSDLNECVRVNDIKTDVLRLIIENKKLIQIKTIFW